MWTFRVESLGRKKSSGVVIFFENGNFHFPLKIVLTFIVVGPRWYKSRSVSETKSSISVLWRNHALIRFASFWRYFAFGFWTRVCKKFSVQVSLTSFSNWSFMSPISVLDNKEIAAVQPSFFFSIGLEYNCRNCLASSAWRLCPAVP